LAFVAIFADFLVGRFVRETGLDWGFAVDGRPRRPGDFVMMAPCSWIVSMPR
jgi:hypothetical protein